MQYTIAGMVIRGDGYGRKLGFPTANVQAETKELPPFGVYAGEAILENKRYRAGILINPAGKIEAHLIGYDGDAYDKEIILEVKKFLREYRKFDNENELIAQIRKDLEMC